MKVLFFQYEERSPALKYDGKGKPVFIVNEENDRSRDGPQ